MSTAIPPRTSGIDRMRSAQPAGKRLPGPQFSEENARQNALDNAQFDKQAAEYAKPTTARPALIVESEIEHIRQTITTGSGRLSLLTKVANIRHSAWQVKHGETPLDVPNRTDQAKAEEFFKTHGERLADQPRKAPDNPLKPAPSPSASSINRAEAARRDAEAKAAAAALVAPPAPAPPAEPTPAPATPAGVMLILADLREQGRVQSKQITTLTAEVKRLAEQIAAAPAPAAAVVGETFTEFVMDSIACAPDSKTFEQTFKARGPQYKTHGVRIWPEILPELGIDPDELPQVGLYKLPKALKVRAAMKLGDDGALHPNKVVGLAK